MFGDDISSYLKAKTLLDEQSLDEIFDDNFLTETEVLAYLIDAGLVVMEELDFEEDGNS